MTGQLVDIKVGDEVIVETGWRPNRDRHPCVVKSKGRVWCVLESTDHGDRRPRSWKLRMDTLDDGTQNPYRPHFLTTAQFEHREAVCRADDFLESQGIRVDRGPWKDAESRVELADLLRGYIGRAEAVLAAEGL